MFAYFDLTNIQINNLIEPRTENYLKSHHNSTIQGKALSFLKKCQYCERIKCTSCIYLVHRICSTLKPSEIIELQKLKRNNW